MWPPGYQTKQWSRLRNRADADVAIFLLGTARPKGEALYVFSEGDAPPPDDYETEGLRLARVLETIAAHGPKETVVLVDECREGDGATCRSAAAHLPDGVSAIVASRRPADASGAPVAGLASLGSEMLPLMRREGLAYLDLYGELTQRVSSTNVTVSASPSLTRGFAFLPTGFLAQLDEACNRVDPEASADTLRQSATVAPLVPACERAARTWAFADHFKTRLEAAREQAAFQRAIASCDMAAMGSFLSTYGASRLAPAVTDARAACEARDREAQQREAQARERDAQERQARERQARETSPPPPAPPDNGLTCTVGGLDPNGDNWLALRHGPSPQAPWSTTHMGPGTTVTAFAQLGQWMHVRLANGEEGWASRHFLSCGDETLLPPAGAAAGGLGGTCVVAGLDPAGNNWLALREQPSFQSPWSATRMGPGTPLAPLERYGIWLHVRLRSGETGWANARFVRCGG